MVKTSFPNGGVPLYTCTVHSYICVYIYIYSVMIAAQLIMETIITVHLMYSNHKAQVTAWKVTRAHSSHHCSHCT